MRGIKAFIILPMASFYFPVMPWGKGPDYFVPDPMTLQMHLKQGRFVTVSEFCSVIGLDALNGQRKGLYEMFQEDGGRIRVMFLEGFHKTPSGILVNRSILEEVFSYYFAINQACGRDELHIDLDTLSRTIHLLIGFRDILGIGRMDHHDALFFEEAVKAGNGAGIVALHEFYPEHDQPCIGVPPAYIENELDFIRNMLVGMVKRSSGTFTRGFNRAVITTLPTVNILPGLFVFDGSFGDTKFFSSNALEYNYHWQK